MPEALGLKVVPSPVACAPAHARVPPGRPPGLMATGHLPQAHLISLLSVATLTVHSGINLFQGTFLEKALFERARVSRLLGGEIWGPVGGGGGAGKRGAKTCPSRA